tara:strand:- start:650 stop:1045 length:396 start_codon:yes stop_codon:yes gene_type:complete
MLDMKSFNSTNFNLNSLDNNKLLAGISIVMLNIGSRYLVLDISDSTKELLQLSIIRRVTLFCIFYLGTRSFKMSILLTAGFIVISAGLFNEKSMFCILPNKISKNKKEKKKPVTMEQYKSALEVVNDYNNF